MKVMTYMNMDHNCCLWFLIEQFKNGSVWHQKGSASIIWCQVLREEKRREERTLLIVKEINKLRIIRNY